MLTDFEKRQLFPDSARLVTWLRRGHENDKTGKVDDLITQGGQRKAPAKRPGLCLQSER